MAKPQQPEIARSGHNALDPAVEPPTTLGGDAGDLGRIPEDQLPGHHPAEEQDKPSGDAFLQKLHEHAASAESPSEPDTDTTESERADRLAEAVGKPFEVAADLLQKVRDRLD